jgi:putative membrane protein
MMDGWDWVWGTMMMIVFWGGLAAVVVAAVRASGGGRDGGSRRSEPDARAILENRFASGELSREEFEDRKRVLGLSIAPTRDDQDKVNV